MKKPWVFGGSLKYCEPYYFGFMGPGFLNQSPTLPKNLNPQGASCKVSISAAFPTRKYFLRSPGTL